MYDVTIIGAGISGLVCGCYLAKAGLKVLIVEQHDKPGGYFTSFKRKGFLFDAAAHSFGNYRHGGHVRKILSDLGVSDIVTINRHDPSDVIITPDFKITLRNDIKATIDDLGSVFPKEKNNIVNFFKFLTSSDQGDFSKLRSKTFLHLLRTFFEDKKLISSLSLPVFGNGGLPPSLMYAFNGAKIFSEFLIDGGYYPQGGIQKLPDALASIVLDNGGEIQYRKHVSKISNNQHSVSGIQLVSGERFRSSYVVSACDLTQTLTVLLDKEVSATETMTRLDSMMPSLSTFILYIGIDAAFEGLSEPGTNVWYLSNYDLDYIYLNIEKCIFDDPAAFMYRVSPDQKTILAFMSAPFVSPLFWEKNKQLVAESFLARIAKLIPNLSKHIVYFDAASPITLQRYTLNHRGAAFGWAKLPEQTSNIILSKIPPLKGLYYTGHWTNIGFGLPGTCYSGWDTAKRILRKANNLAKTDKLAAF
jgi:phytoene dehydrogenase-like protein